MLALQATRLHLLQTPAAITIDAGGDMTSNHLARAVASIDDTRCPRHSRSDSLLVRVGDGDREAFAALYDDFVQTVYTMSLREGHEPSLAAKITFDVFLCAWLQAGTYDPKVESASTWVRAIAWKTIASQSRSLRVTRAVRSPTPGARSANESHSHV